MTRQDDNVIHRARVLEAVRRFMTSKTTGRRAKSTAKTNQARARILPNRCGEGLWAVESTKAVQFGSQGV